MFFVEIPNILGEHTELRAKQGETAIGLTSQHTEMQIESSLDGYILNRRLFFVFFTEATTFSWQAAQSEVFLK